ncbi:hypothetical protein HLH34_08490 [Gluconacetobacter azotocaptans]|uniref:AsmA-like C-terminal domain-containing protein n=2 Tax=Gluconacetobacter azotocaptans TaxID=142834 RepID=A0A7W4JSE8_9PROT|nr:hypothetical protein [Gluconacetobacter azotocaptans]
MRVRTVNGMATSGQGAPTRDGGDKGGGTPRRRRRVLPMVAGAVAVPVVGLVALGLRLSMGPMDVTPLARLALPATVVPGGVGRPAAARLDMARVRIGWDVLHRGLAAPVDISADGLRLLRADGAVADRIGAAHVVLAGAPLVHGRVAPLAIDLSSVRLALRRRADGSIALDLGEATPPDDRGDDLPVDLGRIRRLEIADGVVTLADARTAESWRLYGIAADLRTEWMAGHLGLTGRASVGMSGPKAGAPAVVRAEGRRDAGGIGWRVSATPVTLSAFAAFAPALSAIDVPLGLDGTVHLRADGPGLAMRPGTADLRLDAGAGRIDSGQGGYLLLDSGHAKVSATFAPSPAGPLAGAATVRLDELVAQLRAPDHPDLPASGPVLRAGGVLDAASLTGTGPVRITLSAGIPSLDFATMGNYWPAGAAKGARLWVTRNITRGTASDLHISVGLQGRTGWHGIHLVSLGGGVNGSGLDVHWLRPIAPMHGLDASLVFDGPDSLSIAFDHGVQLVDRTGRNVDATGTGRVEVGPGRMRIDGLLLKDQMGDISTTLRGNARDVLALLAEPRLHLLSRHPLGFSQPSGQARISLHLALPLTAHVKVADIKLDTHADITRVHLGKVVLGRGLDDGRLAIDATTEGLTLRGGGRLGGVPATISYSMDFRTGPEVRTTESARVRAHITPDDAARTGLTFGQRFEGSADLDVAYDRFPGGDGRIDLNLNLDDAALTIPVWRKARGQAAHASVRLGLDRARLSSVEAIHATGPELSVDGRANVTDGQASRLVLRGFRVGRSRGDATVGIPAGARDPIRVAIHAPVLDLSPLLASDPAASKGAAPPASYHMPEAASGRVHGPPGRRWVIDAEAGTLYYSRDAALQGVRAYLEDNGVRLMRMRFSMAGPSPATAILTPETDGRHLWASVQDLGQILHRIGLTGQFSGGRTTLQGVFDDRQPSAPFSGILTMDPIMMRKAPDAVRLANNASIYGWMQAPRAPGFLVDRVSLPLTFRDGTLSIHDGLAGNASLGVTLQGAVDLDRGRLDLKGTIVPAFAVNAIPGHMPGVGRLLSPEKGGGLLAATFVVSGAMNEPALHVNPFSVFLPGVLRRLVQ